MILYKLSYPGWKKEFPTEQELKAELYNWICGECKVGFKEEFAGEIFYEQEPVDMNSSLNEMLDTACGCEFYAEENNEL